MIIEEKDINTRGPNVFKKNVLLESQKLNSNRIN